MNKEMDMREVLEKVKQGEISVEEAEHYFRKAPFDEMGYAKLDMAPTDPVPVFRK